MVFTNQSSLRLSGVTLQKSFCKKTILCKKKEWVMIRLSQLPQAEMATNRLRLVILFRFIKIESN